MRPCQRSAPPTTTIHLTLSVDVEPHPLIEQFATTMLLSVLGELSAGGISGANVAITIDGYQPASDWAP